MKGIQTKPSGTRCKTNNTMKTDPKNSHASRAPSHPELSTDNKRLRKYRVALTHERSGRTSLILEAASLREAWLMTEVIDPFQIDTWKFRDGSMNVCSIRAIKESPPASRQPGEGAK